jgi:site-specific recombinase XerD
MKKLPLQSRHYHYLLQSYKEWLQTIGYADSTVTNWPIHVRELLHYVERKGIIHITQVTGRHINSFVNYIKHRSNQSHPGALNSSSINSIINALNSFAKYLNSTGKYTLDITMERMEADTATKAILTIAEIMQLYEATFQRGNSSIALGQRDRAIIAVFYGCGLRRMEGMQLNLDDIDLDRRLLFVKKGKGNKQRYVPIASKHAADIKQYIREGREWFLYHHYNKPYNNKYPDRKTNADEDALFISQYGGRMKDFYGRLGVLAERAAIDKAFGLHTLRHSIATHLLQSGMAIEEIARFLGHSSLDSTQIYTHIVNEIKTDGT